MQSCVKINNCYSNYKFTLHTIYFAFSFLVEENGGWLLYVKKEKQLKKSRFFVILIYVV